MEANNSNQPKKAENAGDPKTQENATNPSDKTDKKAETTKSKEPTLRSYTTDSSRVHKNSNDEGPTGGNIR